MCRVYYHDIDHADLLGVLINPRHACAARVTVLGCVSVCLSVVCLSVCVSVCLQLFSPYRDQAGSSAIPTALAQQGLEKFNMWRFCSDKATYLHGPLTDSGSVEHWQFYDGEARVLER